MRWVLAVVACAACDGVLGLSKPVPADAGAVYVGQACDPLTFDRLRYHALDMATVKSFTGFSVATALAACQTVGMELVSFDDGDTMELANELSGAPFYYWTGLQFTTAGWANPDGCLPAALWRSGSPGLDDTSACGLMTDVNEVAAGCGNTTYGTAGMIDALCETPRPSAVCLAKWNPPATSYRVPDLGSYTYAAGMLSCNQPNEHVVVIDSSAELATVEAFASSHGVTRYWIGTTFSGSEWTTVTNCPAVFPWDYANGEPNLSNGNCAWIEAGAMQAQPCNGAMQTAHVICETDP